MFVQFMTRGDHDNYLSVVLQNSAKFISSINSTLYSYFDPFILQVLNNGMVGATLSL